MWVNVRRSAIRLDLKSKWMRGQHFWSRKKVDECNTGEVGKRELVLVFSAVRRKVKHDAWMSECFSAHNSNLSPASSLSQGAHVVCSVQ